VNTQGEVIGIVSFRIGEGQGPFSNVAIPIELFTPVKDELIAKGRIESRGPRPWLGLYTIPSSEGLVVAGASPNGPAGEAGFQRGDLILRVNGEKVEGQEDFYRKLWQSQIGQEMALLVLRESRFEVIKVRPVDRYQFFRTRGK
jgi:serine protease Do